MLAPRISPARLLGGLLLSAGILAAAPTTAGAMNVPGLGSSFQVSVKSHKESRWDGVIKQRYDYSCGSAAVATLLTYHYDRPTHEAEAFQVMFKAGDQQQIRAQGFSMLDMKRFLDSKGLQTDGFRMSLGKLAEIGVPAIALVDTNGYRHFVVIKGLKGNTVLVGDPAIGTVTVPRAHFEKIWNGVVLAARADLQIGQEHFNDQRDWAIRPDAPLQAGLNRNGLGIFTLTLPGINELGR